mmetsp:Transcript_24851/g.56652  ORF Transcript_24851/g.56652 Transcript_24851/m.56652 type:complete len:203 (-) Transcript_24851:509-1117(-)
MLVPIPCPIPIRYIIDPSLPSHLHHLIPPMLSDAPPSVHAPHSPPHHSSQRCILVLFEVLGIFAKVEYCLPNMIVCALTHNSVNEAIDRGVTCSQIVDFLKRNAHPQMGKQVPVLPETVVNQIQLWAQERNRLQADPARVYDDFSSLEEFDAIVRYAQDCGVHLWSKRVPDELRKSALGVHESGHARMKLFIQQQREDRVAR